MDAKLEVTHINASLSSKYIPKEENALPNYLGPTTITPTAEPQVLETKQKIVLQDITVNPVPNTFVDVSRDTVASEFLLEGKTAHSASGESITGSLILPEEREIYSGPTSFTPSGEQQIAATGNRTVLKNIIINPIDKPYVDTSQDTVNPQVLEEGFTAHDANGELITGTKRAVEGMSLSLFSKTSGPWILEDSGTEDIIVPEYGVSNFPSLIGINSKQITFISVYGLYCNKQLLHVYLPRVTQFRNVSLFGCSSLLTVDAESCQAVGGNTFGGCSKLQWVYLSSCQKIDDGTFKNPQSLESLWVPDEKVGEFRARAAKIGLTNPDVIKPASECTTRSIYKKD